MRALLAAACILAFVPGLSSATVIEPLYGVGAYDTTPVAPLPDNPGTTLGDQRRFAHEHVLKLAERMFWLPDDQPVLSAVGWEPIPGLCAQAFPVYDPRVFDSTLGIHVSHPFWLQVRHGINSYEDSDRKSGTYFEMRYSDKPASLSLNAAEGGLVASGLHEVVHLLGFGSFNPAAIGGGKQRTGVFDLHIQLGDDPTPIWKMSQAMLDSLGMGDADARWVGIQTSQAAGRLLTAGHVNGQILLDSSDDVNRHLGHLSLDAEPWSLMAPAGAPTDELGIVAYMLSDMGWGPVVDTAITATAARQTVTAAVRTTATPDDPARNVVVTATLPDGVRVASMVETPATCATDADKVSCAYATHHDSASIQYALTGTPGVYAVEVDVDHQDYHVDPKPANNFATVQVTVGVNTIEAVTLSRSSVAEGRPRDTEVGRLGVDSAADASVTHTFELTSDAAGGAHNACFRVDGERLLTAKPFDREGLANLNLRVLAKASNGFTRAQNFTVAVTSAGSSASAWTWSTAAHADTSANSLDLRSLALAALLLCVAGHALSGSRRRRTGSRLALALTVLLLTASCGGGGGGGSSPAPPPRPAFTC